MLTARTWHKYQRSTTNVLGTTCSIITHTAIRAASQNSVITDPANRISVETSFIETYSGSRYLDGRPLYQKNEDGSTTTWEYELDNTEGEFTVITYTGTESNPMGIVGMSTYEVEVTDLYYGHTLSRGTALYCGAQEDILLSSEQNYYDDKGRLTSTEYSDGTSRFNLWSCCRLLESIARDGTVTQYWEIPGTPLESESYNSSLGALPGANGLFPINGSVVDLMGRTTNSYQAVGNGAAHSTDYAKQVTTTEYPAYASYFRVTTDPLGVVTTNRISINYSHRPCVITDETIRAGVTTTALRLDNGEPETTIEWTDSVSGISHTQATKTESEIQPNGWKKRTSYIKYDDGNWITQSVTTSDFLGRVVATTTPLGTTSNFYDSTTGRLTRVSRTGSPDVLYFYDELGEQTETCVDINSNGAVDYSGTDQITTSHTYYQKLSNDWWQVSSSAVYFQTNSTSTVTTSVSRVRMTGLGVDTYNGGVLTAQSESEDWNGNITRSSTYTDAANATTWQVTDTPTSTQDDVRKSIGGYPVQTISTTRVTNTFTYDGFARQVTATDGRTNTTFTAYNDFGQVSYTQSFTNRMSYFYDDLGRRTAVSNALGQVSYIAYDPLGKTIATWGTSYPVAYQFDSAGRMIAMATTRSNTYANVNLNTLVPTDEALSSLRTQNLALDITRWYYDETTGLLTNKVYADGNGTVYTYTETGKLHTRTWARGKTTTYTYSDLGQITNVDYSGSTPDITYTHDRLGRILSALSSASTSTFYYDGLTLDYETQNGWIIKRNQDVFGRDICYELFNPVDLVYPCQIIQYGYECFNRLSTVTSIIGAETNTFTYTYLQGADLVYTMNSDSGVQWTRQYESKRDLITAVSNSWDTTTISSVDYLNDQLGRRTRRADYFNSATIINTFIYNQNSEVIGASIENNNYNYKYDPIGNRAWNQLNGSTNTYVANQLNQYISVSSAGSTKNLTHDNDGNLTFNGSEWHHTYDGENRLLKSEPHSATNGSIMFEYRYNHKNLRVEKTQKKLSGRSPSYPFDPSGAGTWNAVETRKYVWDGHNIAAETITDYIAPATNISCYTWGLDLSGTLQGAGGVGGLLSDTKIVNSVTNTYFAVGDGNGNITEYVDNTGAAKAHYEYSAVGEITVQSGSIADDFIHRFSTKPFDKKTRLVQYEYRPYDALHATFITRDPIGERDGPGLYLLLKNDGVNEVDKFGLFRWLWQGCCNGKQYNRTTHCCCDRNKKVRDGGKCSGLFERNPIDTGMRLCNDETEYGSLDIFHHWIEIEREDGELISAGFHGRAGKVWYIFGARGIVHSPAGEGYTDSLHKKCKPLYLDPCLYDIERVRMIAESLIRSAKVSPPRYCAGLYDCRSWSESIMRTAVSRNKKQGECGDWKILN
ncbi:MAG: hypothetical protein M0P27_03420 [Bacteroidales bacterium]|nr:hypothetical protein [Bacteroidales bacterium]